MDGAFFNPPLTAIALLVCGMAGLLGGSLGPAVVWNRLGLLGDTISHASLSIMAVGLILGTSDQALLIPFAILIALTLSAYGTRRFAELDSVLAVLFSGLMGFGLILVSYTGKNPQQILTLLTGDISRTSTEDLLILSIWTTFVLAYLLKFRIPLRLIMAQPELAKIQGQRVALHRTLLLILICVSVALCIQLMGVILVTTLFVTPALIAKFFARSASGHATLSMAFGILLAAGGAILGDRMHLGIAPTIATLSLVIFILSSVIKFKKLN